jgi:hypothetical protein
MKTLILILLSFSLLSAGCSSKNDAGNISKNNTDSVKKNNTDGEKPSFKRIAPKQVQPLKVNDIEYLAPVSEMGYINAKELSTGKTLWSKQVYKIEYDKNLEKDVQDVFIDSLWQSGDVIMIHNEKGEIYELDPATQSVVKK